LRSLRLSADGEPVEACPRCGKTEWRRTWFGRRGRVWAILTGMLPFFFGNRTPYDFPEPDPKRFQCKGCGLTVLY
jgi:hypothetical protein